MKYIILVAIAFISLKSQDFQGITEVVNFIPGEGQNAGQASEYFPENIFGLPSKNARALAPESSPAEILSLGLDGEITVRIKNTEIVNGSGYDFIIYENAFKNPLNGMTYAEPAKVAVSQNGIDFIEFPFNEQTLEGCAGVKPTKGSDNYDPETFGGDKFDLETLGLENISYIKITDITRIIKENPGHDYYDPTLSGFDLDAVVAIYTNSTVNINENLYEPTLSISQNQFEINISSIPENMSSLEIYDILGNLILKHNINASTLNFIKDRLNTGTYFFLFKSKNSSINKKVMIF